MPRADPKYRTTLYAGSSRPRSPTRSTRSGSSARTAWSRSRTCARAITTSRRSHTAQAIPDPRGRVVHQWRVPRARSMVPAHTRTFTPTLPSSDTSSWPTPPHAVAQTNSNPLDRPVTRATLPVASNASNWRATGRFGCCGTPLNLPDVPISWSSVSRIKRYRSVAPGRRQRLW
jgi:hypothetical protein